MTKPTNHKHITPSAKLQPVGRFAPSPTGPLHFGTLLAALGSYLLAKQAKGKWLLRIEDLDPPRVVSGAADAMLTLLEQLGFEWDSEIIYQRNNFERYRQAIATLRQQDLVYDCNCTRREILASAPHPGEEGPIYPGTCRQGITGGRVERATRLRVTNATIHYNDGILGEQQQQLEQAVGDFILCRTDGLFAYQLAVVVDDIDAGVTQVVRGADLLSSTPRQIFLYNALGIVPPDYFHLPLAFGDNGKKLSKRNGEIGLVTVKNGSKMLWQALQFLGQSPPSQLIKTSPSEILNWGIANFDVTNISTQNRQIAFKDI